MRIALLGAPAVATATQVKRLATRYHVARLNATQLLRDAPPPPPPADTRDQVIVDLISNRLRARDCKRGFIIHGYPDTFPAGIPQAQALDALLGMLGRPLQIAIHLKTADTALLKSVTSHQACKQCNAAYSRHDFPPTTPGKCDTCGGDLVNRRRRRGAALALIAAYQATIAPLLAYYKAQHKLRTVPTDGDLDQAQQKICDIVDLETRPLEITHLDPLTDPPDEGIDTIIAGGQINRTLSPSPSVSPSSSPPTSRAKP